MAAKKASGVNFKQLLLEKGERWGFMAAAGLLVFFLGFGVFVASRSASATTITKDIASNIQTAKAKMTAPGQSPPEIEPVVFEPVSLRNIKFNEFVTPHEYFNPAEEQNPKRVSPRILPASEAQVEFVRGAVGVYDMINDNGKTLVGVLVNRPVTQNDANKVKQLQRKKRPPPPPGTPGAAGVNTGGGLQGGVPSPGGNAPPPGVPQGGSPGRGGPGMPSKGGPGGFGMGGMNQRTSELQVQYMDLESKDIEKATLAETLEPVRMVVVTGSVPYKAQVMEFVRALRAGNEYNLGNELPLYRGFVVERSVWSADGKEMLKEWEVIDMKETLGELYARTIEFEYDEIPQKQIEDDPEYKDLAPLYFRLVPDRDHKLALPRPRLKNAIYGPITLPTVKDALKKLKELGGDAKPLKTPTQTKLSGGIDPFDNDTRQQRGFGGGEDDGRGGSGISKGGAGGPGGGPGIPKGGAGVPTPGVPNTGMPRIPQRGGDRGDGPQVGSGPQGLDAAVPEDAWIFRFIDTTTVPGYAYRYRIQFKMTNPNFKLPIQYLATPDLAGKEELPSDWFVLPQLVQVPKDEFVYAAANEPKSNPPHVTEKVPTANLDETWLQMQRWFDFAQPKGRERMKPEPIGDWLIADIRAIRGQYVSDLPKVELPIWSMTQSLFLFRDNPPPRKVAVKPTQKDLRSWDIDFTPKPDMLVVDFEGGTGDHVRNAKGAKMADICSMDVLLMTDDGKLRVVRSTVDLADEARKTRFDNWTKWLLQVQTDTTATRTQGADPFGGGDAGRPGGADR